MPDARRPSFTLGSCRVAPNRRGIAELPLLQSYTGDGAAMRVHVVHGARPGPVLFVSAAVHGDELNGVEIVRRLLRWPALETLNGTLLAVPVVNVPGLLKRSRYLPDRRDLNRCFPGTVEGVLASRVAHLFMDQVVNRCDYGIDLHTGALDRVNLPQLRIRFDQPESVGMARAFGTPMVLESTLYPGSLRAEGRIPILTFEGGEAMRLNERAIRAGLHGVQNVMRYLGMVEGGIAGGATRPIVTRETRWIRSPASGLFRSLVRPGTAVKRGEVVGMIGDPLSVAEEPVKSGEPGVVIGTCRAPLVHEGDALYHLAECRDPEWAASQIRNFHRFLDAQAGTAESSG